MSARCMVAAALAVPILLAACESRPPAAKEGADSARTDAARAGAPAACRAEDLAVRRVGGDAGAGHRAVRIALVSSAAAPCTLAGHPVVTVLDSAGRRVTAVRAELVDGIPPTGRRPAPVTLAPGEAALFDVHWTVVEGEPGGCPEGAALAIAPPDARADGEAGRIEVPVRACGARLQVTPLVSAADTIAP